MPIEEYLADVKRQFETGIAREHAYRPALKSLIEALCPHITATNDPARIGCGAPDFILSKNRIDVGYIEAKDIGLSLDAIEEDEQLTRYRKSLDNLLLTDYLEFRFFVEGRKAETVRIGRVESGVLKLTPEGFERLKDLIVDFCSFSGQTITSSSTLAKMMAMKSKLMAGVLRNALEDDVAADRDTELHQQLKAFRTVLMHDLEPRDFAGIYAQTIAYGMFAARLHDTTLNDFSRQEAATLIPRSNPFLRKLFHNIAGPDLDRRIDWIVEALVDIFRATDVASILSGFGASTGQTDPFVHFYETFLAEYDPELRRAKGVWYTPEPVVNFIVRSVDAILEKDFGLVRGLADNSRTRIRIENFQRDKRTKSGKGFDEKEIHRVQILDPATGTGTFLARVVNQIFAKFKGQEGGWPSYVASDLVPRLHGFEILMASYAVAHLKLERLLEETGCRVDVDKRLHIYLTNSLEEHHPDTGTLFSTWLSTEASQANLIKRDTPVMVVLGNPPYSTSSANRGQWIMDLVAEYKKDLNERNVNALSDDYVKFIRYGHFLVARTGEGVLAYISNNSYLDGVTHRTMRRELLSTFDDIYVLNLHGDSNKGEVCPDGSPDKNVFDIKQGVAISIFVKTGKRRKGQHASVFYTDLFGTRTSKYEFLDKTPLGEVSFAELPTNEPYYWFVPRSTADQEEYESGFGIDELFKEYASGIKFRKDNLLLRPHDNADSVKQMIADICSMPVDELTKKYSFEETQDFQIEDQRKNFTTFEDRDIVRIQYRPFDVKYSFYPIDRISKIIPRGDSRKRLMQNMLVGENYALLSGRQNKSSYVDSFFVTEYPSEMKASERTIQSYHFPLYIYTTATDQVGLLDEMPRRPNFVDTVVQAVADRIGLEFSHEPRGGQYFSPIELLDYVYAVLNSTKYRTKFVDQLKVNFPRIPFPRDSDYFHRIAAKGAELRLVHTQKDPHGRQLITKYPVAGTNEITRRIVADDFEIGVSAPNCGRCWLNDTQYIDDIPVACWEFGIGGYLPAQKWLKDRMGRKLSFDEIHYYQSIIARLNLTIQIVDQIDQAIEV